MKKLLLIVNLILFTTSLSFAQKTDARVKTTERFIQAVFADNKDAVFITNELLYHTPNDKISTYERFDMVDSQVKLFKKKYGKAFAGARYSVSSYTAYKGKKLSFANPKDIYIVSIKNKPVVYLLFHENRIFGFDYVVKGNKGDFVIF
ncbi:hypothetical protein GCM10023149_18330 [Mucilaginibacter gynuensis]|uniref:DUF4251 domain-containing protein n=1 Tax=Mucilaginibacter gynuensis TaxID=1302236 RepID=A0ABP8G8R6_9SPHI